MRHDLRPYQQEAVDAVFTAWQDMKRVAIQMATGCGKTTVIAAILERLAQNDQRSVFCAHTEELVRQGASEITDYTGLPVAIEKADETAHTASSMITMASIQSIGQRRRMERFSPTHYDVVGVDEGHRCIAPTYRRVFDYFAESKGLCCSATLQRSDKRALSRVIDAVAYEYSLSQAIKDGYLCPIHAQQIPVEVDLSELRMRHGDWADEAVDEAISPHLVALADLVVEYWEQRSGIVFLPLVATSQAFAELLRERGIKAEAVWGTDPDRAAKIQGLKDGSISILTNANLLVEGFNCPHVSLICPFVPTRSRPRYIQQIGRGTRIYDGKENLLILDPLWLATKHKACVPASLLGETEEIVAMAEGQRRMGGRSDVMASVEQAADSVRQQREQRIIEELEANKYKAKRTIDPITFGAIIHDEKIVTHEDVFDWEKQPATTEQKDKLYKAFDVKKMTQGEAEKLIDAIEKRQVRGLATARQVNQLHKLGFDNPDKYTFKEASRIFDVAKNLSWMPYRTRNAAKKKGLVKH